jgi:PAS domain S-box-containing protein
MIALPAGETRTVYMRVKTGTPINLALRFESIWVYIRSQFFGALSSGVFIGILLLAIGYFGFLSIRLKDRSLLHLTFSGAFLLLYLLSYSGMGYVYLWSDWTSFNQHLMLISASLTMFFITSFTDSFLSLQTFSVFWHKVLNFVKAGLLVLALLSLIMPFQFMDKFLALTVLINIAILNIPAYIIFRTGDKPGRYFFFGGLLLTISLSLFLVNDFALLVPNIVSERSLEFGVLFVIGFWTQALAWKIGLLREDKERAFRELKDSQDHLKLIIDAAELAVWDADLQKGVFLCNERLSEWTGIGDTSTLNDIKAWQPIIHPDDFAQVKASLRAHLKAETPFFETEFRLKSTGGEWLWVLVHGKVLERDQKGIALRLAGTQMDISDLKTLEQQLLQAQKMEAIGQLAGGVAHDFNNLITIISGYSTLLLLQQNLDATQRDKLDLIRNAAERAESLTRQLLAFSRKQIIQLVLLDFNKTIAESLKFLGRLIGEDINVETVLVENLPFVYADPHQIEQILMNVVVNARDAIHSKVFNHEQKKITVSTGYLPKHSLPTDKAVNGFLNGYNYVSIADNGTGMKKEVLEKVFEPFFTTKPKDKGTGLGLSMVYGIVTQNKGDIQINSEPGTGTTFTIYWPAAGRQNGRASATSETRENYHGTEHLLIVEDDAGVRNLGLDGLQTFGYRVDTAENGVEAIALLQQQGYQPDLVITDLIMPGMNGRELAVEIRKIKSDLKIMFTSGYSDLQLMEDLSTGNGTYYLQKPYALSILAKTIRQILDSPFST